MNLLVPPFKDLHKIRNHAVPDWLSISFAGRTKGVPQECPCKSVRQVYLEIVTSTYLGISTLVIMR